MCALMCMRLFSQVQLYAVPDVLNLENEDVASFRFQHYFLAWLYPRTHDVHFTVVLSKHANH